MGQLTERLLTSGYAVMTLDAEYHGERSLNNSFKSPLDIIENEWFVRYRDMIIESSIDYRRGIDYLTTRTDIDISKIGIIGCMGGMMTFFLSAIDNRIDVSVSCVSPIITVPYLPTAIQNYAPYIKEKPFLMLMGKNDERNYSETSATQLYNLIASSTKNLMFFESGHMLPLSWTHEAIKWIEKYLK
jgi:predicted esterase